MDFDNIFDLEGIEVNEEQDATTEWLKEFASKLDPVSERTDAIWSPQEGPQEMAFYSDADELFYGGAAGGGKVLCDNNILLTPFGWKKIQEIKEGDTVIDIDGGTSKVIGVYPHTNFDAYRVTFADGGSIEVSDGHLWSWWKSSSKRDIEYNYILHNDKKGIHVERTMHRLNTTKQLYEYHSEQKKKFDNGGRPYWIIMPLPNPIRFTRPSKTRQGNVIRINPYLLGLLLGDGCLRDSGLNITTIDEPIKSFVEEYAGNDVTWDGEKHLNFKGETKLELIKQLKSYNLWNTLSHSKFIPDAYLFASLDVRYDLMAGLIDSDGYIDDRGHISYTSISEQLAKDVQHLARSLGCKATITSKVPTYTDNEGNKQEGQLAYNVWIQGDEESKNRFSKLPRKKDNIKPFNGGVSEPGRRVTDIEPIGKRNGACIAIDHPLGLHVVQDFIVTHNTDLMIGLATSQLSPHKKAIMFRKTFGELKDVVTRTKQILDGTGAEFRGGNQMRFDEIPGGKSLELGSAMNFDAAQKYKGRPHDLKLFDEVSDFDYSTYTFLIGWARSAESGVPVRIVASGNPPTNSDGEWVIRRWGPWLDPTYVNPAEPGELRWFSTLDGEDREITPEISEAGSRGEPFEYLNKLGEVETVYPQSRTFIPAKLDDNEFLGAEYRARLQAQPEPYRSQLLYGDFGLSMKPDPWQVIPTQWVNLAFNRWEEMEEEGEIKRLSMVTPAYGLDVAEGGNDLSALAKAAGNAILWVEYTNEEDTMLLADWVVSKVKNRYHSIGTDAIQIGVGPSDRLRQLNHRVYPIKVTKASNKKDRTGQFEFMNMRTELWWRLREALDPNNNEEPLALPRSRRLLSELTAPKFSLTQSGKLSIQKKIEIRAKLGFSTDGVDAIILALYLQRLTNNPLRIV